MLEYSAKDVVKNEQLLLYIYIYKVPTIREELIHVKSIGKIARRIAMIKSFVKEARNVVFLMLNRKSIWVSKKPVLERIASLKA